MGPGPSGRRPRGCVRPNYYKMYYVYILKSLKDSKNYIGQTNNLAERLRRHNSGGVSATKHRTPLKLIYQEKFLNREEAIKREKFFKSHKGYNYLKKWVFTRKSDGG